ncbi:MAG: Uma2 family endonuclease [Gammaproteobacteria bacterium]|nr:Uma2 family endonuclease [Gammaproteobacteria bacterium]
MPQAEPISSRPRPLAATPPRRRPAAPVHYPESDGKPMGETFLHVDAAIDVRAILVALHAARSEDACVGCNNFVYYEEGNPRKVVTPDVFVAYGVPQDTDRRVFKIWEEGVTPDWVLEVTSKSTWREDEGAKRRLYERLGVTEYWQFDPTGDYLDPILKGRALADGRYRELELERRDGGLCRFSEVLGLDLRLEGGRLRFFDPKGGKYLLTPEEQRRALEAAEARIRELERQRRPEG